jgi:hypothetical protein
MSHLAAEENWTTTFTFVNKSSASTTARLSLFGDALDPTGNGPLTLPLAFPQQAAALPLGSLGAGPLLASSFDRTIAGNASLIVTTAGPQTPPVLVGSAQLAATGRSGWLCHFPSDSDRAGSGGADGNATHLPIYWLSTTPTDWCWVWRLKTFRRRPP